MVQFEPSAADQLAHPLQEFVTNLGNLLKPNQQFQLGMQKALGANPELAQNLADLEYNAPGTLSAMGFGQLGDILSKIPESTDSQLRRTQRGEILDLGKKKIQLESGKTGFSLERLNATIDAIRKDPSLSADAIHKELTGLTVDEAKGVPLRNELTQGEIRHVNAEASVEEAEAPVKIAIAKRQQQLQDTLDKNPQLQNYDALDVVRRMMNGESVNKFREFLALPGAQEAVTHAQSILMQRASLDERTLLRAQYNHQLSAEERQNIIQAGKALSASGRVGTLQSWRTVLEHPEKVEDIRSKQTKGENLSQEEKDILAASKSQQEMQDTQDAREQNVVNNNLIQARRVAEASAKASDSPAGLDLALKPLNDLFALSANRTGKFYQANYGAKPEVGKKIGEDTRRLGGLRGSEHGLYFTDENGTRVDDNAPFKNQAPGTLSSEELRTLTILKGLAPADRAKEITRMQKDRPDIYNKIKDRL